ncbi:uncharacterized protein J7T54_005128 [Emericellopsis cladophorae]|uniref:Uncharacterized protein n=1 Tax=Emericellopsis cladophorae TaxID=2686198 RepID=A0A9P9Y1L5_9HYPO|nr:uncharacterized protein J7T54_005128 [Emericellopsis cladophorae]KAI6781918.1 hypothetical protein J7T54_005128 [Emericellopsis cladophorae]
MMPSQCPLKDILSCQFLSEVHFQPRANVDPLSRWFLSISAILLSWWWWSLPEKASWVPTLKTQCPPDLGPKPKLGFSRSFFVRARRHPWHIGFLFRMEPSDKVNDQCLDSVAIMGVNLCKLSAHFASELPA